MKLREIKEDVEFETEPESGEKEHEDYESRNYNQVFNAVANHFDIDGEEVDTLDDDTKKEFYDMLDKCWDSEDNKVPDACPIDIDLDDWENGDGDHEDHPDEDDEEKVTEGKTATKVKNKAYKSWHGESKQQTKQNVRDMSDQQLKKMSDDFRKDKPAKSGGQQRVQRKEVQDEIRRRGLSKSET